MSLPAQFHGLEPRPLRFGLIGISTRRATPAGRRLVQHESADAFRMGGGVGHANSCALCHGQHREVADLGGLDHGGEIVAISVWSKFDALMIGQAAPAPVVADDENTDGSEDQAMVARSGCPNRARGGECSAAQTAAGDLCRMSRRRCGYRRGWCRSGFVARNWTCGLEADISSNPSPQACRLRDR